MHRTLVVAALAAGVLNLHCSHHSEYDLSGHDAVAAEACGGECVVSHAPEIFGYDELVRLSAAPGWREGARYRIPSEPDLEDKLNLLLDDAFVSNEAYHRGVRPHRPVVPGLGTSLNAALWNIERGQELPLILSALRAAQEPAARDALWSLVRPEAMDTDGERALLEQQLDALAGLDVLVLNEVDLGMKRSGYADVVAEIAAELDMNYAYAVEFAEVDPIALGLERFEREDFLDADGDSGALIDDGSVPEGELRALADEATALTAVDPSRAKNLHGNAILSRYPIASWKVVPLTTQKGCWDWNAGERKPKDLAGRGMDYLAEKLFLQKSMREIRHGGRSMLMVDLVVPGVTADGTTMEYVDGVRDGIVTVVNVHLEAKSTPACRKNQMKEVLSHLEHINNPVIMAGDLNSVGTDGRPMTVPRLLLSRFHDPQWIAKQIAGRLAPYSGWAFTARDIVNWIRVKDDPTGIHIPLLLPNEEKGLFDAVEQHRFADGGVFDFRGDERRTTNQTARTLANSNQRDAKGFKTSFAFQRTYDLGATTFGHFKLDWMFVRGWARSPRDDKATYRFAPHFPQTLEELRDATAPRMSDHAPMTVVIPLGDPCGNDCAHDAVGDLDYGDADWETSHAE